MPDDEVVDSSSAETVVEEAATEQVETPETPEGTESATVETLPDSQEETVVASDATKTGSEHKPSKAEQRIKQLTARIKALEAHKPEPEQPKPALKAPVKPSLDQFETIEAYDKAVDDYADKMRAFGIDQDRREREAAAKKAEEDKTADEIKKSFDKRVKATVKRNPEFVLQEALQVVQPSPTMDGFILDSDIGPDLLAELANDPDECERIRELSPFKAVRELVRLEEKLNAQIKGIKTGKPAGKATSGYVSGTGGIKPQPKSIEDLLYS
jgi:hypothetical protein